MSLKGLECRVSSELAKSDACPRPTARRAVPQHEAGAAVGLVGNLGFGRIVGSETEAPNILVNLVWSG